MSPWTAGRRRGNRKGGEKENARPEPGAVLLPPVVDGSLLVASYRREVAVMLPSPVLAKPVTM